MDITPPTRVSLDDIEKPAVKAGSIRIVVAFALVLSLILGLIVWSMVKTHQRRMLARSVVPSAMNTAAARPAESNRAAAERGAPTSTYKPSRANAPDGGPVIRYDPGVPPQGFGGGGQPAAESDPAADAEKDELVARKAPLTVQFSQGAQPTPQPPTQPGPVPMGGLPEVPVGQDPTIADAQRQYGAVAQQRETRSVLARQAEFNKGDEAAILTRAVPLSEFGIVRGTPIHAILDKASQSELPGQIEAHISHDVFNSRCGQPGDGCYVEIPKGSRLIGEYNTEVGYGQNRLQAAWKTLIFPDTSSIDLGRMAGYSSDGTAGLKGPVDNHWKRLIGGALLTSAFSAGFAISQSRNESSTFPTAGNAAAAGVGQGLNELGQEMTRRNMDIPPVVKLPVGMLVDVDLTRSIDFDGPYKAMR